MHQVSKFYFVYTIDILTLLKQAVYASLFTLSKNNDALLKT